MSDLVLQHSAKDSAWLISFTYGNPIKARRFTDYTSDVTFLGQVYESIPSIELSIPENTAGIKESPLQITFPGGAFSNWLSSGHDTPAVYVELRELTTTDTDSACPVMFAGDMTRTVRNYRGRSNSVMLEAANVKQMFEGAKLGIQHNVECAWAFGSAPCAIAAPFQNLPILNASGSVIITSGLNNALLWPRGYVEVDALRLPIQFVVGQQVVMRSTVPPWVIGQTGRFVAGCLRTIVACRAYLNEEHFMGLGFATPAFQPQLEAP